LPPTPRKNNPRRSGTFDPTTFRSSGYAQSQPYWGYGRARIRYRTDMFTGRFSSAVGTTLEASNINPRGISHHPAPFQPRYPALNAGLKTPEISIGWAVHPSLNAPVIFRIASPCLMPSAALCPPCPRKKSPRRSGTFAPTMLRSSGYGMVWLHWGFIYFIYTKQYRHF